ncbi:aldehyde dehydrogenase family protein [Micromonospora rifamycinica]|uniref:aldehyde dehydrogenase family protein n=1 Tax=Micromonospora rifamycinica TaxID=291594 RepID=UPI002E290D06|nr:aldehyde dehydrogenase family protein [Micromonospora rifamycinica]
MGQPIGEAGRPTPSATLFGKYPVKDVINTPRISHHAPRCSRPQTLYLVTLAPSVKSDRGYAEAGICASVSRMSATTHTDRLHLSCLEDMPHELFIGGKWTPADNHRLLTSFRPSTGETLATVAHAGASDVSRSVAAAAAAGRPGSRWHRMSPAARSRLLHRIGDLILDHADRLAMLDCLDNGKPLRVARAGDVPAAAAVFHYMAGWPGRLNGEHVPLYTGSPERHLALTVPEPVGVVAAIVPWNFPLYMAAAKVAPALAAGCTVVLKPAEQTPLSALALARLTQEAGLPPGVLNVVTGDGGTGAALAAHPGVDKVTFTGSTEVGRGIVRAAAVDFRRVTLELGGKSPNIVFSDADLPQAVAGAAHAIFYNQGETCVAGSRLYVQRPVFDEVVAGIRERAAAIRLGDGLDRDTDMGPLISAEHRARVLSYLRSARDGGAQVTGGHQPDSPGYFCAPAVVTGADPQAPVVREEVFGPVLVAEPFDTVQEAVAMANDSPYGLAAGVFTRDLGLAHQVGRRLRAGTVWINSWHVLDPALPFGGVRASGWGREMGRAGVDAFLETKTLVNDLGSHQWGPAPASR